MILKTQARIERTIFTKAGKVTYNRYSLIPVDDKSKNELMRLEGVKSIFPLDCAIKVDRLPFKTTVGFMMETCWLSIQAKSYQKAEDGISYIHRDELKDKAEQKHANSSEHEDAASPTKETETNADDESDKKTRNPRNELMLINDDTIREMTNYIGKIIYMEDCRLALTARHQPELLSDYRLASTSNL